MRNSNFIGILVVTLIAICALVLLPKALKKNEVVECHKLQRYSETYEGFWLTDWQAKMCEGHGIFINAPIRQSNYD